MSNPTTGPRAFVLLEANYRQLLDARPNLAVLPWGATEAHNYHLPHGTDVIEATEVAMGAAQLAHERGARVVVLPAIPFGNNAQQLDQVATIHLTTTTAAAILGDIIDSLTRQGIERLVIVNAHGGNEFKPIIRDLQARFDIFIVLINFWQMIPEDVKRIFDAPGDHAGELETSLILHLAPHLVVMAQAGDGRSIPFHQSCLKQSGVWTPRPWSKSQPDTGAGDPAKSSAEKGREYLEAVTAVLGAMLLDLSAANREKLP